MRSQQDSPFPSSDADLAEAESSLLVHLELYSWLGNEAATATACANLRRLYERLGDHEAAEAMRVQASRLGRQA